MSRPVIRMVQILPALWRIETPKGNVLQHGIVAGSLDEAENIVRSYVSGFHCWDYVLVPL